MRIGILTLLMICNFANASEAGQWSLGLAASRHADDTYMTDDGREREYQSRHAVIGYHHYKTGLDAYLFNNSYNQLTLATGKRMARRLSEYVEGEVFFGGAIGYEHPIPFGWVGLNAQLTRDVRMEAKLGPGVLLVGIGRRF